MRTKILPTRVVAAITLCVSRVVTKGLIKSCAGRVPSAHWEQESLSASEPPQVNEDDSVAGWAASMMTTV